MKSMFSLMLFAILLASCTQPVVQVEKETDDFVYELIKASVLDKINYLEKVTGPEQKLSHHAFIRKLVGLEEQTNGKDLSKSLLSIWKELIIDKGVDHYIRKSLLSHEFEKLTMKYSFGVDENNVIDVLCSTILLLSRIDDARHVYWPTQNTFFSMDIPDTIFGRPDSNYSLNIVRFFAPESMLEVNGREKIDSIWSENGWRHQFSLKNLKQGENTIEAEFKDFGLMSGTIIYPVSKKVYYIPNP